MALIACNSPSLSGSYPANGPARRPLRPTAARRWQGRVLTGCGLALLPWIGYLAGTLPPAEAAAWAALDMLEAAALLAAGTRLLHTDPRHRVPAATAAVLLVADACLDLATAVPGTELATALAMAVGAELPLAALCAALAARPARAARGIAAPRAAAAARLSRRSR